MANLSKSKRNARPLVVAALCDLPKIKKEIKSKLPLLRAKDIRRYRIPYSQVLLLELREEGYFEAAEYFEFLFKLDEDIKNAAGPGTLIWNKPRLKDNHELISQLRNILISVFNEYILAEIRTVTMIGTALSIENSSWEWWWIADSLYRSAFCIEKLITSNDKEIVNCLRYLYANFLFKKLKKPNQALEYVNAARQESRGKSWNASKIFKCEQDELFKNCSVLMHYILIDIASEARECDVELAVNSCKVALSSALEIRQKELVAEAHFELGKSENVAENFQEAIENFFASLAILEELNDPEGICEIHSRLASIYKRIDDEEKVLEHFQKFKDVASEYSLPKYYAKAHYLTGEYHLAQNDSEKALLNFEVAFSTYNRLGERNDANRARCSIGISKGQQQLEKFKALVKGSVEGVSDALLKIIIWKDSGESFN